MVNIIAGRKSTVGMYGCIVMKLCIKVDPDSGWSGNNGICLVYVPAGHIDLSVSVYVKYVRTAVHDAYQRRPIDGLTMQALPGPLLHHSNMTDLNQISNACRANELTESVFPVLCILATGKPEVLNSIQI